MNKIKAYFSEVKKPGWVSFILRILGVFGLIILDGIGLLPIMLISKFHLTAWSMKIFMLLITLLIYGLTMFLAYKFYKHTTKSSETNALIKKPLFHLNKDQAKAYVKALIYIFITQTCCSLLNSVIFKQHQTANNKALEHMLGAGNFQLIVIAIIACTVVPICEELIFRGCVINGFFKKYKHFYSLSIILCGILFSSLHLSSNPISFLTYMLAGMILAYSYERSGSLRVSMACHATNNVLASLMIIILVLK